MGPTAAVPAHMPPHLPLLLLLLPLPQLLPLPLITCCLLLLCCALHLCTSAPLLHPPLTHLLPCPYNYLCCPLSRLICTPILPTLPFVCSVGCPSPRYICPPLLPAHASADAATRHCLSFCCCAPPSPVPTSYCPCYCYCNWLCLPYLPAARHLPLCLRLCACYHL